MKLIVGLGNPGAQYAGNRHNIGFMAVDRIAEDHGFAPWKARFQGETAEGRLDGEKVLLLKPATYMNRSGQAVGEAARFYKIAVEDVCVFHDELDLPPGRLKVKAGGGHAGHNGLRSIHQHLGDAYQRVRLGIGHPGRKELVSGYVLHDFAKADQDWLDDLLRGISDGAGALAKGDAAEFMNRVARRIAPARNKGRDAAGPAPAESGAGGSATRGAGRTPPSERAAVATPATGSKPQAEEASEAAGDNRTPLQRLADRFR